MQTFNQSFNAEQSGALPKRGSGHPKWLIMALKLPCWLPSTGICRPKV